MHDNSFKEVPATLVFRPVKSRSQLEHLRRIRNQCAEFMTNFRTFISKKEQKHWWKHLDRDKYRVFLCYLIIDSQFIDSPIGYGLIYEDHKHRKSWITGGLREKVRNKGLGKALFKGLIQLSKYEPWLEVLNENPRARKLYDGLGFQEVETNNPHVTTMVFKKEF
jgi:ribosomal protein S18 acetylase RimI-like enzyme